jgi:hypothetical protein
MVWFKFRSQIALYVASQYVFESRLLAFTMYHIYHNDDEKWIVQLET